MPPGPVETPGSGDSGGGDATAGGLLQSWGGDWGLDSSRSPHWIVLPMAFYVSTFHCVFSSTYQQHCSLLCGSDIFLF